ncbi:hypothetical protein SAY87_003578 [Trapa incisa]|uniref:Ribulose bisphosphate carboxylase large chain n=1 Tax=Trapa incisa TaxID=236973 RepID=A0AAN7QHW0_9MYRT|nr:hypothetical protein SAY87_003578 [Trapa incisa]
MNSPKDGNDEAFRVTPQSGVPPEEAGAAVAAESSTVWTDGLTSLIVIKENVTTSSLLL